MSEQLKYIIVKHKHIGGNHNSLNSDSSVYEFSDTT